jgi:hypothetical protein
MVLSGNLEVVASRTFSENMSRYERYCIYGSILKFVIIQSRYERYCIYGSILKFVIIQSRYER